MRTQARSNGWRLRRSRDSGSRPSAIDTSLTNLRYFPFGERRSSSFTSERLVFLILVLPFLLAQLQLNLHRFRQRYDRRPLSYHASVATLPAAGPRPCLRVKPSRYDSFPVGSPILLLQFGRTR